MTAPLDRVLQALDAAGCGTKRVGRSWAARCPAHDDRNPSLTVDAGRTHPVVLNCHAGCSTDDVLAALHLTWGDLCTPNGDRPNKLGPAIAAYMYTDEKGFALFRVVRYGTGTGKTFRQHKWEGDDWGHKLGDARRVLYRLPEVLAAVANGAMVWIAEGEKDVDRLRAEGVTATCNPGGAGKWLPEHTAVLATAKTTIVVDKDRPGAEHAHHVAASLSFAGAAVTLVEAADGKDASDHFARGHGLDDFVPVTIDELRARLTDQSADDSTSDADGWQPPVPLGRSGQLPDFPIDALPDWLRDFAVALAKAMQVPVDLPGVLVLSVLATAAGGRAVVEVREGFREPTNLFTASAMEPGERKTPTFNRCIAPLEVAEKAATEDAAPKIAEAEARQKVAQAQAKDSQDKADRASDSERERAIKDAAALRLMAEAITVPTMPRLLADDATPESLVSLMAEQGGRIAVLSDEGDIFNIMAGRYSKTGGPNLAIYLKGHAGSRHRVDRKSRAPEYIERPALTLGLAVQPEVLRQLRDLPGARGLGLLARFMWSVPTSMMGWRKAGAAAVPVDIGDRYDREIVLLVQSLAEWTDPAVLPLTTEAHERLLRFEEDLEPRLGPSGDLVCLRDWAAKLVGHTARIAGLLHLARNVRSGWGFAIEVETVEAAIAIAEYFVPHALAVFDLIGADPKIAEARDLVPWLKKRDGQPFSRRDIHQAHRARFTKAADIDPALELLEEHDYIRAQPRPESSPRGGRPPAPTYDINPLIP